MADDIGDNMFLVAPQLVVLLDDNPCAHELGMRPNVIPIIPFGVRNIMRKTSTGHYDIKRFEVDLQQASI